MASAVVYVRNKPYGQGLDSSIRVKGDPRVCEAAGAPVGTNDCHLEGLGPIRAQYEIKIAGGCNEWWAKPAGENRVIRCLQAPNIMSCDHYGDPVMRDDPNTDDVFEGNPPECGLQRSPDGKPMAGFFVIAHGLGEVWACLPGRPYDDPTCGPHVAVDH